MGVDELGVFPSNEDITSKRDLEASGDGESIDSPDDGLPAVLHLEDGIRVIVLDVALEDLLRRREIHAGAESSATASDDDGSHRIVPIEHLENASEIHDHLSRERVEGFGAVDGHHRHAGVLPLHHDELHRRRSEFSEENDEKEAPFE